MVLERLARVEHAAATMSNGGLGRGAGAVHAAVASPGRSQKASVLEAAVRRGRRAQPRAESKRISSERSVLRGALVMAFPANVEAR
jgi:hypothetical protein